MMYRLHARLAKVEEAQMFWVRHATDSEFEARFGVPGLMQFLYARPDEEIDQLAAGDSPTAQRLWQEYLMWHEERWL